MRLDEIRVKHLRSLKDATLSCGDVTSLIGSNGAGKSSFLRALDFFYTPVASYTEGDFYNRDTETDISICVTFGSLTEAARQKFRPYLSGDRLSVEKVLSYPSGKAGQKYYGSRLYNPHFDAFRGASGVSLRREYQSLRDEKYGKLPEYQNKDTAEEELRRWEEENPDVCERRRDDGQFFGFNPVGQAALDEHTRFIFVPAVRDAGQEAAEARGSALTQLMDLVVRATLAEREDLKTLQEETQQRYEAVIAEAAGSELGRLQEQLSGTLGSLAPGSSVSLEWLTEGAVGIPMPQARIRLIEDEFAAAVEHTGHGLQRAFLIALLQHLTIAGQPADEDGAEQMHLILGIEEPELYQHPNRQRHLGEILATFSRTGIKGAARTVRVVYTTHSPLFVSMRRFDDIRVVRKHPGNGSLPKHTRVKQSSLERVARGLERMTGADEGTYTLESTRARLAPIMTPWMNEGFFADLVLLVEGEEDRAALLGEAERQGRDFEAVGISVIPALSKNNLDRPIVIFSDLGIRIYVVFDGDFGGNEREAEKNRQLLTLLGAEPVDWPEGVLDRCACFKVTMTDTIRTELGEEFYNTTVREVCYELGYAKVNEGKKNSTVMREVFWRAHERGLTVPQLSKIVEKVVGLRT